MDAKALFDSAPEEADAKALFDAAPELAAEKPTQGEAFANAAGHAMSFGLGPMFTGLGKAREAALAAHPELLGVPDADLYALGMDPGLTAEKFAEGREADKPTRAALQKEYPKTSIAGTIVGSLPTMLVPGGPVAGLSKAANAVRTGTLAGAVGGAANTDADLSKGEFGKALEDTSLGMFGGAAFGHLSGLVLSGAAAVANKIAGGLDSLAIRTARRMLMGGTNPLSVKKPMSTEVVREAFDQGAVKPLSTVYKANDVMQAAREQVGQQYADVMANLQGNGFKGPVAHQVAIDLLSEGKALAENSLGSPKPAMFRARARELMNKPTDQSGRLDLMQAENMKRTLQREASKEYDKLTGDLTLRGEGKMEIASRMKEAIEDAVNQQASFAPGAAAEFEPVKEKLSRIIEASDATRRGAAMAARRKGISLTDAVVAAGGLAHGGVGHGLWAGAANAAGRTFGPSTGAWLLDKAADLTRLAPQAISPRLAGPGAALLDDNDRLALQAKIDALRNRNLFDQTPEQQ